MPLTLQWGDIALRLVLTVIAGTLVGIDRSERGQAAGLRTTILVCLAAAVAMIQMNLLLPIGGKAPDSFANLDLMRLPLGILTGVGFIGGGAILRRGNLVLGVTTAATLWIVTVIGLCLGGGQIALGIITLTIALVTLWVLKKLEGLLPQEKHATLSVSFRSEFAAEPELSRLLSHSGFSIRSWDVTSSYDVNDRSSRIRCELSWRGRQGTQLAPPSINEIARLPGVIATRWNG